MQKIYLFILVVIYGVLKSQSYSIKSFNWKDAGFKGNKPVYTQTLNILNYGGNNTNTAANNIALTNAINALNNNGGVIYFPKGIYSFTSQVSILRDSITFIGAGYDSTQFEFNLNGLGNNCINIIGTQVNADTSSFVTPAVRDSNWVNVLNSNAFNVGDWVYLQCVDNAYMSSTWAYGTLGQILHVKAKTGNKLTFHSPFRYNFKLTLNPKIKRLVPKKAIGFECLKVKRLDATTSQTSLFDFDKAVQCWIHGLECDSSNFSHVELNRCSNIEITNSYFHHAFAYGGGGQGYGVVLQTSSNECKVENNIFNNLRHSILFQSGSNGNVCGYNYSFNPFWIQSIFPTNSAGDIVFHGNFPFANLCEGNINQNTVIDDSHGLNGPYNTLFRNRSELYGVFMNSNPPTDTVQFLGLEVTNNSLGLNAISGNGHLQYGNMIKNVLTPPNTNNLTETSLYYSGAQRPLCFNTNVHNWSILGIPNAYNTNSNAAKDRAMQNKWAECNCSYLSTVETKNNLLKNSEVKIYPNPATQIIQLKSEHRITEISIYNTEGKLILNQQSNNIQELNVSSLKRGLYLLSLKTKHSIKSSKLIIE